VFKKKSKYKNKKIVFNGIKFDSIKEKNRYIELKLLEKNNIISGLKLQPAFLLQESFNCGKATHRAIKYVADFEYFNIKEGKIIIEDVKGHKTEVYKIKKKLFLNKYIKDYSDKIFIET
jgi:hypothetical protein